MTGWWAWLLVACAALAPARACAQGALLAPNNEGPGQSDIGYTGYAPPANGQLWLPLYHDRPEDGGLYLAGGFNYWEFTNPIKSQLVAVRGFLPTDNSVLGGTNTAGSIGVFQGPRNNALDTVQVGGPQSFEPGFTVEAGWRFPDSSVLSVSYTYIFETQYRAVATLAPPNLENLNTASFLFANVFNFPAQFGGPAFKINPPNTINPFSVYGIWNGATAMTLLFHQRVQQLEATYRCPFYETECYRISGLVGPRFFWIWEGFQWRTTDQGSDVSQATPFIELPNYVAVYSELVSNVMYGAHVGIQQEWYAGHGFAFMLEAQVAGFLDVVKEEARYGTGVKPSSGGGPPENKRSIGQMKLVPEFQVTPSVMWYPWEGIQLKVGYDLFAFLNTVASPRPVDFNYSALDPNYVSQARWFNGFNASIAFIF
jgi:hypothetical protein